MSSQLYFLLCHHFIIIIIFSPTFSTTFWYTHTHTLFLHGFSDFLCTVFLSLASVHTHLFVHTRTHTYWVRRTKNEHVSLCGSSKGDERIGEVMFSSLISRKHLRVCICVCVCIAPSLSINPNPN